MINRAIKILFMCLMLVTAITQEAYAEKIEDVEMEYFMLDTPIRFDYDDAWFNENATDYSSKMAVASLCLATSTFATDYYEQENTYAEVYAVLDRMHFDNIYHNKYYNEPTQANGCAVVLATKELDDTTLVVIAVRGGHYGKEWSGNFAVGGKEEDHKGFSDAKEVVINELKEYMNKNVSTSKVKFWITGFSRGSAVANLVAAELTGSRMDNYEYSGNDVFAYCFETPANTTCSNPAEGYQNIFNIIDPNDLVPKIPPALWGFTRYGRNVYIPVEGVSPAYDEYLDQYVDSYNELTGMGIAEFLTENDKQFEVSNRCITVLANLMRSRKNYSRYYQGLITGLIENGTEGINYLKLIVVLKQSYDELMVDENGDFTTENLKIGFNYLKDHLLALGSALLNHSPITVLSWLKCLQNTDVMANCIEDNSVEPENRYSSVYLRIYGDVISELYENDVLLLKSENGEIDVNEANGISAYIDEEGAAVYKLPWNMKIKLFLKADEACNVCVSRSSYALDSAVCNSAIEYVVKIDAGSQVEFTVDAGKMGCDGDITIGEDTASFMIRELSGDDVHNYLPSIRTAVDNLESNIEETESTTEQHMSSENDNVTEVASESETTNESAADIETDRETEAIAFEMTETEDASKFITDSEETETVNEKESERCDASSENESNDVDNNRNLPIVIAGVAALLTGGVIVAGMSSRRKSKKYK